MSFNKGAGQGQILFPNPEGVKKDQEYEVEIKRWTEIVKMKRFPPISMSQGDKGPGETAARTPDAEYPPAQASAGDGNLP